MITRTRWIGLALGLLLVVGTVTVPDARAQARGKIAGQVTEAGTGEPLPGVNVVVEGTTLGMATDNDGEYFIANLEPGTYTLRASFVGFRDVTVTNVQVRPNSTTEVDIAMEEATLEIGDEVVVTATRPLVEKDNTTSLVVLETQEITTRPTRELTDVLTSLPSVNVENGEVKIRGGTLDEVAFVLDGLRVRNPADHSPYTRINLSAIQEVEVITGAFNAEYGEARSGIINVITKEGGDTYELFLDSRYTPADVRHWGPSFYDRSTDLYWENTHARHLEWWIEYPDQWVDPNGFRGSDPRSTWTPEEAYQHYLETHQPLTEYDEIPGYQMEVGLGGPIPLLNGFHFFGTARYRSEPPVMGNAFRDRGEFVDGTLKLTYRIGGGKKITASGFYGVEEAGWGYFLDHFWAMNYARDSRYAYFDQAGFQESSTDGQSLIFTHVLSPASMYEIRLSRLNAFRKNGVFPGDPIGFAASDATRDNLRAVDENGNPVPANRIGYHTSGYLFRFTNRNTEWTLSGFYSNQLTKHWHVKTGLDATYYVMDHFNEAKFTGGIDDNVYRPYQGAVYAQNKLEFGGFIMNAGLRLDFYNPNEDDFVNIFEPISGEREDVGVFAQLSPRLGVSHPIDERTVLHFSYGHFFQRPPFFDNGEGLSGAVGSLTTLVQPETGIPVVLGNRDLRPEKTIAYEVGIERNFWDFFVVDVTGFYKDSRNTLRTIEIETPQGTYRTNGNGDYGDYRGVEFSLRKVPSVFSWGALWGYANFTTQLEVVGRSGDPVAITPGRVFYGTSGDDILHKNPIFKAGFFYETPGSWKGLLGVIFRNISVSADYRAIFPNENLRQDIFIFEGEKYTRPVDQVTDLRARKEISLMDGSVRISPYLEVQNLFNDRWIFLQTFERASLEEQRKFVESDFEYLPSVDASGVPILPISKFRNLPRSVVFGVTVEL